MLSILEASYLIKFSAELVFLRSHSLTHCYPLFSHSVVSDSLKPHGLQHARLSLFFTISHSLLKLMSIESMMASNHLILCHPLLLLPSILPNIQVFSNDSTLRMRWPKYWSFSISISPSNEYSGLISFRIGWLDFLAVQGTLKSCFQHHNFKVSIFQCSASLMVQLLHLYMITGKTIALTVWTLTHRWVFSPCVFTWSSHVWASVQIFPSYKDTSHVGLGFTGMTSF